MGDIWGRKRGDVGEIIFTFRPATRGALPSPSPHLLTYLRTPPTHPTTHPPIPYYTSTCLLTATLLGSTPRGADDSLRKYEEYLDSRSYITQVTLTLTSTLTLKP